MKSVSLEDLDLSPEESKGIVELLARKRGIKDYESLSIILSKPAKKFEESKFLKARIREIEREFKKSKHKLSKSIKDEIRKNLYEIKNRKNLFKYGTKNTEKSLDELENFLFKTKKYYDKDDEYKGIISDIKGLLGLSNDKDYYRPVIVKGAFNNNYVMYESNGDKNKILSPNEYLDKIRSYLVDMVNDHKNKGEWKIQLTAVINFISSKPDSDETCIMYTKSINVEIMTGSDTNELIEELFESLLKKYQENLEKKMRGLEFIFDGVNALHYDLNKISLNRGRSYVDSPQWLKTKKQQ